MHSEWELGQPWWNPRAVKFLERHIKAGDTAFEWGSGGSTVWLVNHGVAVTSIEHNAQWLQAIVARCPAANVHLVGPSDTGELRSERQLFDRGMHFWDDYVHEIDKVSDDSLDVVIVDGICRVECARRAAKKVKPGGLVVLDDSQWPFLQEAASLFEGWSVVNARGFKPRHQGEVWQTTFFRRPMFS